MLALSAVQAVSQIGQGYAEKAEANLNATIVEGKIGLIGVQKDIENEQYNRAKGQALSTGMAGAAAAGIKPTGSAMAVMLDTQRQMSLDQAIGQWNFDQEKQYVQSEADAIRRGGDAAVKAGWTNAFSTMLKAGYNYGTYKGFGSAGTQRTQAGTVKDTTFDSVYTPMRGSIPKRNPAGWLN